MQSSLYMPLGRAGLAALLLLGAAAAGAAQPVISAQDLIDKGATRLPADAVKALLAPGASVGTIAPSSGNTRRWTNEPDGNLAASSRGRQATSTASGTWNVTDGGLYCIDIAWKSTGEQWCRAVYQLGPDTYLAPGDLVKNADKQYGLLTVGGRASAGASTTQATPVVAGAATPAQGGRSYLAKAEIEQTFIGKSFTFKRGSEIIQWELKPDGNLFATNRSRASRDAGSWQLADDGKLCIKWRGNSQDGCRYYYKDGEKFLITETNQPGAPSVAEVQEIQ